MFVCGSVTTITLIVCIDPHQTGFVGKGVDHLQLVKFWPFRTPGKGVCGGAKKFGSALLQPARSVCVSLSAFFISGMHSYFLLSCGRHWTMSFTSNNNWLFFLLNIKLCQFCADPPRTSMAKSSVVCLLLLLQIPVPVHGYTSRSGFW